MNPLVVWLPSIAAAALLCTAAVVMSDTDDERAPAAIAPVAPIAPIAEESLELTAADIQPDAAETKAVQDADGSKMVANMEQQLEDARRILSTMKNSRPTRKALKSILALKERTAREIRELKDMGSSRVPADLFHRSEEIIQEIKAIEQEAVAVLKAFYSEREERKQPAQAAPGYEQQVLPAQAAYGQPAQAAYEQPARAAYEQPAYEQQPAY